MAGVLVPLFGLKSLVFDGLDFSTSMEVPIARAIDVLGYSQATLISRVHSRSMSPGAAIAFKLLATSPSREQPEREFIDPTALLTLTLSGTPTLGIATTSSLGTQWVRVVAEGTLGASGTCNAALALDLLLQE